MAAPDLLARLRDLDVTLLQTVVERAKVMQELAGAEGKESSYDRSRLNEQCDEIGRQLGLDSSTLGNLLNHVQSLCERACKTHKSVAYLGPIYSYSYLAAVKHFGMESQLTPVTNIEAAFDEVTRKQSAFAVVPIENNNDGRVVDTLGMFARSPVQICGEVDLPIHHCLLGLGSRSDIKEVHSKPQAISQCRRWLANHLPNAVVVESTSTASAAARASKQSEVAAIASEEAGVHYGLKVIDRHIEDNTHNVTRFVVIGNQVTDRTGDDKTSLMFQLDHQPGALANAMVAFQSANINLTWIESFPLPGRPNEYLFFVELDGHRTDGEVKQALENLTNHTRKLDVLGSFPQPTKIEN